VKNGVCMKIGVGAAQFRKGIKKINMRLIAFCFKCKLIRGLNEALLAAQACNESFSIESNHFIAYFDNRSLLDGRAREAKFCMGLRGRQYCQKEKYLERTSHE
jgi:hypothetical protein